MSKEKASIDFILGNLYGEIAWLRKLKQHTETNAERTLFTPEELAEYNASTKAFMNCHYGKVKESEEETDKRFKAHRLIAHRLLIKYLPHEIEFTKWVTEIPKDLNAFYFGFCWYLWDTDECCYTFKEEDIIFDASDNFGSMILMKIKFKLDSIINVEDSNK